MEPPVSIEDQARSSDPHEPSGGSDVAQPAVARPRAHRWLPWLVLGAALVGGALALGREWVTVVDTLARASPAGVALIAVLALALLLSNGLILRLSLALVGVPLAPAEAIRVGLANSLWIYLPASAGLGVKALYLRRAVQLRYSRFAAITAASLVVAVLASACLGAVLVALRTRLAGPGAWLFGGFVALAGGGALALLVPLPQQLGGGAVGRALGAVLEGWSELRQRPALLVVLATAHLARTLILGLMYLAAASSMGVAFDATTCMLLATLAPISLLVQVTPGGLGVRESLQTATAVAVGYPAAQSLSVVLLATGVVLLFTLVLGLGASLQLSRRELGP